MQPLIDMPLVQVDVVFCFSPLSPPPSITQFLLTEFIVASRLGVPSNQQPQQ